jgi:hypothetical protein
MQIHQEQKLEFESTLYSHTHFSLHHPLSSTTQEDLMGMWSPGWDAELG